MRTRLLALAVFLAAVGIGTSARSTLVRSMNLKELAGDAKTIVKATLISRDTVQDTEESGMIATYYTFKVEECLKCDPAPDNELVIKQVGQGSYTLGGYRVRQNFYFPEYEVGKTYVLFLPEAHHRTGLLAPVGLQQGVFDVVKVNGVETIPQLKTRANVLKARIRNTSRTKFLLFQLDSAVEEPTYENFKTMIEAARE